MEGLGTFLIIAGVFYFMMRFGCGSHMKHGHGGHGNHSGASDVDNNIDPVCGMKVETEKGYGKLHQGMLYRFCSKSCLDKFDAKPELYLNKEQEEHHHDM
ncbi:MAG: YHS domain-containing protein [Methylophaga sp.]|nr:YHS domain-containing protein [Methylophaga sp.]